MFYHAFSRWRAGMCVLLISMNVVFFQCFIDTVIAFTNILSYRSLNIACTTRVSRFIDLRKQAAFGIHRVLIQDKI